MPFMKDSCAWASLPTAVRNGADAFTENTIPPFGSWFDIRRYSGLRGVLAMKRGAALRVAVTGVLMAALAACDPASAGHKNTGTGTSGGPPPGGWPQPVNGQLTTNMCGLLTNADYAKYGHER